MSDWVTVKAWVLRETPRALLLEADGRQEWISRRFARHKSIHNREVEIASWLADKLGLSYRRHQFGRAFDLGVLQEEMTLSGGLNIRPKPNQPWQQAAFDKLRRLRCFALFMQMRAGKTKVVIDIVCNHASNGHIDRVLWLCPNSATATAEAQWARFAVLDLPRKIVALETVSGCGTARMAEIEAWITSRTAVVVDESQMIKNDRAKRSRRLAAILETAPVTGILSGTPITQNVQDLYNQARALDWRIFGYRNVYQFNRAHLVMSDKIPGLIRNTRNTDYLSRRLQPFVFEWFDGDYRHKKIEQTVFVPMSDEQREWIDRIKAAVLYRLRRHTERSTDIYLLFTAIQSVLSGHVSERVMRHIFERETIGGLNLETPKLDRLEQIVEEREGQTVVWCARLHELHSIRRRLPEAVIVSGEMPAADRHRCIQQFRRSRDGILVVMVQVAKRAIEMSECNEVVYYGHSFDFESREQSAWRTLLPGKTAVCRYTDLVYADSLDERILASHSKKRNVVRDFLDLLKQSREQAIAELELL